MSRFSFITNHENSKLEVVSTDWRPQVEIVFVKEKGKERQTEIINIEEFISVKGEKALGNKLTSKKVKEINLLEPLPYTEDVIEIVEEEIIEKIEAIEKVVEVKPEMKLKITNKAEDTQNTTEDKKDYSEDDDEYNGGQITLEL